MSRGLLTVEPGEELRQAARRMVERRVGAALVLAGERLIGILTERDVLRAVAGGLREGALVSEWMTRDPETIEPTDDLEHATVLMLHGGFRHLPVVAAGRLVGIVSIRDLAAANLADQAPRGV
jgi:CBS domain-containing protein